MTTSVYLSPQQWAAITTTEDVLISGNVFELAYAATKPGITDEGHTMRFPVTVPKGSKAWVRAGGASGALVRFSSLGATAVEPVNIPAFPDTLAHRVTLPGDGSAVTLGGAGVGGKAPLAYMWRKDNEPVQGATAATLDVTEPAVYEMHITDADGYTIGTPITVTRAG